MAEEYPDFIESTGYGTGEGLCGWNCYHDFHPFYPGASVRTYTDEELESMNAAENEKKVINGREYTTYEALQHQRKLERGMRATRQAIDLLRKGKAEEKEIMLKRAKYQAQLQSYRDFSKQADLPTQYNRITQDGLKGQFGLTEAQQRKLEKES